VLPPVRHYRKYNDLYNYVSYNGEQVAALETENCQSIFTNIDIYYDSYCEFSSDDIVK